MNVSACNSAVWVKKVGNRWLEANSWCGEGGKWRHLRLGRGVPWRLAALGHVPGTKTPV